MASKKYLGVYFGKKTISIVESENQKPLKFSAAEYDLFQNKASPQESTIPDSITQTAILQKTIREQKISTHEVHLAVPSQDIIFRSFIIPWMATNELKSVIDFESRKYIPFKLNELAYVYHPITINDKDNKFIRVLLAAVRLDILENYSKILIDSGLKIRSIEPAPLSLIRVLLYKKIIPKNQRIAIIQSDLNDGKIIIVDQGVPQFIRDFQLQYDASEQEGSQENLKELRNHKFYNEIKISLEYYSRQYSQEKLAGIILLTDEEEENSCSLGERDLGIPVTPLISKTILDLGNNSTDLINAYGISLKGTFPLPVAFDIPRRIESKSELSKVTAEAFSFHFEIDIPSFLKTIAICSVIVILAFFLLNLPVSEYRKKFASISSQEGIFHDLTDAEIEKKYTEIIAKLDKYKSVHLQSKTSFFMEKIPKLLPEGTWIDELSISYADKKSDDKISSPVETFPEPDNQQKNGLTLKMLGYAFTENINQQMRLVNNFVSNLKGDEEIMKFFSDIQFTTEATTFKKFTVTSFKIECN